MQWLWVGVAGACGALSRQGVGKLMEVLVGQPSPLGTLCVNVVGSFLLGALAATALTPNVLSPTLRMVLGVGFLGAFTTFSTFSVETLDLLRTGRTLAAFGNIGANLGLGLLAAWAGLALARHFLPPGS